MSLWRESFIRHFEARLVSIFILVWGVFFSGDLTRCHLRAVGVFSSQFFSSMICFFLFQFAVMAVSAWRVWESLGWSNSSQVLSEKGSAIMLLLWWLLRPESLLCYWWRQGCRWCFVGQSLRVQCQDCLLPMSLPAVNLLSYERFSWVTCQHWASCWSLPSPEESDWRYAW